MSEFEPLSGELRRRSVPRWGLGKRMRHRLITANLPENLASRLDEIARRIGPQQELDRAAGARRMARGRAAALPAHARGATVCR